jgi:hypothetical protein
MKRLMLVLGSLVVATSLGNVCEARSRVFAKRPLVQMAILLDTSNSMDGLIDQAKSQLWKIANDLAYASRNGERPTLQIALYEYGNDWLSPGENWVRQVLPFTTDMDLVSEKLYSLRTHGGQEYCGAVIQDAVHGLAWHADSDVYKVIFIAGNEPFTQGSVYFRDAIAQATRRGITVNTIFCGPVAEGVQTQWSEGALAGRGAYLTIDQNRAIVIDPTPYDPEIARLGAALNDTYVAYGVEGKRGMQAMEAADRMALASAPAGALAERSIAKAAPTLASKKWDAVSQLASGNLQVSEMRREDLPAELKSKSTAELQVYMKDQQQRREDLQQQLAKLRQSREAFLAKKQSVGGPATLDQAMRQAIREQAQRYHFSFGPSGS